MSTPRESAPLVTLPASARECLDRWVRAHSSPQRAVKRSRILLGALAGHDERRIATELGTSVATVRLWCARASREGLEAIWRDAPGRGRKRRIGPEIVCRILAAAAERDANGAPRDLRALARQFSISPASVCRILRAPVLAAAPASSDPSRHRQP